MKYVLNCYLFWALLTWLRDDCPLHARRKSYVPRRVIWSSFAKKSMCRLVIIFGSTNAPTPVGLLAGKGSWCRDLLALGNIGLFPILM